MNNHVSKITFTGDLLCYPDMIEAAKTADGYDFTEVFSDLKKVFDKSDCVVGNLETPVAGEKFNFTTARYRFNSPDAYLDAIQGCGIDTVCLANNHCMDATEEGIAITLDACDKRGIKTVGLNRAAGDSRTLIQDFDGRKIAFINYTYGTNAFSHKEYLSSSGKYKVNLTQPEELLDGSIHLLESAADIQKAVTEIYNESGGKYPLVKPYLDRIQQDITVAKKTCDMVIFCLHCGGQYNKSPDPYTEMLIEKIRSYGADIIVGLHPHILQPCRIEDGFVKAFCLGNCVCSLQVATPESLIEKSFSTLLHIYSENSNGKLSISKVTFSVIKLLCGPNGLPHAADTFEIGGNDNAVTDTANYFAGADIYTHKQKEYVLWENTAAK